MPEWKQIGLALATAVTLGACSGRVPPPSPPVTTLIPDTISLAKRVVGTPQTCDMRLVLESGGDVILGGPAFSTFGCPPAPTTPVLFGNRQDLPDSRGGSDIDAAHRQPPLVVVGTQGELRWIGVAPVDVTSMPGRPDPCYIVRSGSAEGAWREDDTAHLGSGPVLQIGATFEMVSNYDEPWPLRDADYLCLDVHGVVTFAATPAGS